MNRRAWHLLFAAALLTPFAGSLAQTTPPSPPPPAAADAAPPSPPPNNWLPKPVAELTALDKVTSRAARLTVRVGQSKTFGSLTITVRACEVRPADQPADAAAFVDISDSHGGASFHGWMLAAEPGLAVLPSRGYDVRASACHE